MGQLALLPLAPLAPLPVALPLTVEPSSVSTPEPLSPELEFKDPAAGPRVLACTGQKGWLSCCR